MAKSLTLTKNFCLKNLTNKLVGRANSIVHGDISSYNFTEKSKNVRRLEISTSLLSQTAKLSTTGPKNSQQLFKILDALLCR